MGGGLMQLVAYGAQDIYLTGNPQITFFKVVYRRHTNFSMESIQQTFNGSADFGKRVTCTISRNGDLVHRMYLQVKLPSWLSAHETNTNESQGWCDYLGHAIIKNVEVEIGGQRIDKQYGEWMNIWNELTQCEGKKLGYLTMIGDELASVGGTPRAYVPVPVAGVGGKVQADVDAANATNAAALAANTLLDTVPAATLYIPLEFWFNRNPGLALPLIALQYHEVKLNFEFNDKGNCVDVLQATTNLSQVPSMSDATLYVDYIYLDTDERRRFAQVSHEYLIEQLQFTGDETVTNGSNKIKLNFNHPCKELIWVYRNSAKEVARDHFEYSGINSSINPLINAGLQLNGHDRFSQRDGSYFDRVQPYQHHENVPVKRGINVYSFALKPEEHQPSGSCNFSRIDNATLQVNIDNSAVMNNGQLIVPNAIIKVFAVNYNVLRIMSGMGGLAYSN